MGWLDSSPALQFSNWMPEYSSLVCIWKILYFFFSSFGWPLLLLFYFFNSLEYLIFFPLNSVSVILFFLFFFFAGTAIFSPPFNLSRIRCFFSSAQCLPFFFVDAIEKCLSLSWFACGNATNANINHQLNCMLFILFDTNDKINLNFVALVIG